MRALILVGLLFASACSFDSVPAATAPGPDDADAPGLDASVDTPDAASQESDAAPASFTADAAIDVVDAAPPDATVIADAGSVVSHSIVTLCIAATGARDSADNSRLATVCQQAPGLIEDCGLFGCDPLFAAYFPGQAETALFDRLDTNADRAIDDLDEPIEIQLVGYSWGGGDALSVATNFLNDLRVAPSRRSVRSLILMVAFRPFMETMEIPEGVVRHWTYRHTTAPVDDCTANVPGGPFIGLPPLCSSTARCVDYDYAADPTRSYSGLTRSWLGSEVDHCTISDAAAPAILHNLQHGVDALDTPPSAVVP